jgi:hypothetical protein
MSSYQGINIQVAKNDPDDRRLINYMFHKCCPIISIRLAQDVVELVDYLYRR